ncbi:hypothetical protein J2X63_003177 [Agromyces sp. 3263]|uniref:phage tail tube protein n=1 Tax=Agromyces sp. 3263 TaxID=2817750 RepID=UPI002865413D|nr:hypothetical protein [Agromyces sp. 3263]MDR6907469.1 hypothetical protein [Agromyces sp. 3263]
MAAETVPVSSQSDGRWRIGFVELADDPQSVADILVDLTYSFTPDGFDYQITQAVVADGRLTLEQNLEQPGKKSETLNVKYVTSTTADSASLTLVEGTEGYLVVRRGVANSTAWAAAQKADIITFKAGAQRPDAPVENGVDTTSQTLYITDVTVKGATLAA